MFALSSFGLVVKAHELKTKDGGLIIHVHMDQCGVVTDDNTPANNHFQPQDTDFPESPARQYGRKGSLVQKTKDDHTKNFESKNAGLVHVPKTNFTFEYNCCSHACDLGEKTWVVRKDIEDLIAEDYVPVSSSSDPKPRVGDIAVYRKDGKITHIAKVAEVDPATCNVTKVTSKLGPNAVFTHNAEGVPFIQQYSPDPPEIRRKKP